MHPALAHLAEEEISELISLYYNSDKKVSELIQLYKLQITPSQFVSVLPKIVHSDLVCAFCDEVPMESKRKSRNSYGISNDLPRCPKCGHTTSEFCSCSNCLEVQRIVRDVNERKMREALWNTCDKQLSVVPEVDTLSLRTAVLILALERHAVTENFEEALPFKTINPPLAPTFEYAMEGLRHLNAKNLIEINPNSPLDAFEFSEDLSEMTAYWPKKVTWAFLPGIHPDHKSTLINQLKKTAEDINLWPEQWRADRVLLWREIAKHECYEYFGYLLLQRDFKEPVIGKKTEATFENLLDDFSTSQIFNITWQAVKNTIDYMVRDKVPRYIIQNSFIGSIAGRAAKAKSEGWQIRHSRRDFNCPQSAISSTYYDVFLGLGEIAFNHFPTD